MNEETKSKAEVVATGEATYKAPVKGQKGFTNEWNPPALPDRKLPSGIVQRADGTHYVPKTEK